MPRRARVIKREVPADPRYGSRTLTRFMNKLMMNGKKSLAERIVYTALDSVERTSRRSPIEVFDTATNTFEANTFKYLVGDPNGDNAGIDPTNNAIGDIATINDHEMLVIERDSGEGSDAKFKRVYLVDLAQTGAKGDVKKNAGRRPDGHRRSA